MATSFSGGRSRSTRRTTDHGQATGKLYHLQLRVEWTFFCNLQSWAQTHAILVIGLYELLGNPTTQLIEPPQALSHFGKRLYILCRCTIYDYKEYNTVWLIIGVTGYINYWWNDYGFHIKNLMNLFKTLARGGHHQYVWNYFSGIAHLQSVYNQDAKFQNIEDYSCYIITKFTSQRAGGLWEIIDMLKLTDT